MNILKNHKTIYYYIIKKIDMFLHNYYTKIDLSAYNVREEKTSLRIPHSEITQENRPLV